MSRNFERPRPPSHHCDEAMAEIDAVLSETPPSILESVMDAVAKGRMTQEEATECLEAYENCFHKSKEIYPD